MGIMTMEKCRSCGMSRDLTACAGCDKLFCEDCIEWCCEEDDQDCGGWFCLQCADLGEKEKE
jgi:hypothetical protein